MRNFPYLVIAQVAANTITEDVGLRTFTHASRPVHEIGRMPIAYRGKDERVERVLRQYQYQSLILTLLLQGVHFTRPRFLSSRYDPAIIMLPLPGFPQGRLYLAFGFNAQAYPDALSYEGLILQAL